MLKTESVAENVFVPCPSEIVFISVLEMVIVSFQLLVLRVNNVLESILIISDCVPVMRSPCIIEFVIFTVLLPKRETFPLKSESFDISVVTCVPAWVVRADSRVERVNSS